MTSSLTSLDSLEQALSLQSPVQILAAVHEVFGPRAAILSSMQRAGAALCHMADRAGLAFPVIFVDTGVLHPETLAVRDRMIETHPHLRVRTLHPVRSFEQQTKDEGLLYLSKEGQERCCELRKSDPLRAIRGELDVLVGALRRDEGGRRGAVKFVEPDATLGVMRIHPFARLSRSELKDYMTAHPDALEHPLHRMGFPTVGCFPCTTPVRADEEERAGRWRHLADVAYCGINPADRPLPETGGPETPSEETLPSQETLDAKVLLGRLEDRLRR